jgi:hypothetical protein
LAMNAKRGSRAEAGQAGREVSKTYSRSDDRVRGPAARERWRAEKAGAKAPKPDSNDMPMIGKPRMPYREELPADSGQTMGQILDGASAPPPAAPSGGEQ